MWVDLEQPTEQEIRQVAQEFSISERIETELLAPTPAPLVAGDTAMALLILHFSEHGTNDGETKNQEIDFIVGNHFIVTVRYEIVASLHHLKKILEAQELVSGHVPITTEVLLEILFAHLYASVRDHTNHTASRLTRVERDMFAGYERTTVRAISGVSREFLHLEAALANQEGPLRRFLAALAQRDFFSAAFPERVERILAERVQVARLVETHRAVTSELRGTNSALLEARQNEIMKTLTVVSFIFLPLELIALIFAMDVPGIPLTRDPNGFWIIMLVMFGIICCMTLFFIRKRWFF